MAIQWGDKNYLCNFCVTERYGRLILPIFSRAQSWALERDELGSYWKLPQYGQKRFASEDYSIIPHTRDEPHTGWKTYLSCLGSSTPADNELPESYWLMKRGHNLTTMDVGHSCKEAEVTITRKDSSLTRAASPSLLQHRRDKLRKHGGELEEECYHIYLHFSPCFVSQVSNTNYWYWGRMRRALHPICN